MMEVERCGDFGTEKWYRICHFILVLSSINELLAMTNDNGNLGWLYADSLDYWFWSRIVPLEKSTRRPIGTVCSLDGRFI